MKSVRFLGDSLKRLRDFPEDVRHDAGYQLDKLQRALQPDDFKPMPSRQASGRDSTLGRLGYFPIDLHGAPEGNGHRSACVSEEDAGNKQARHRAGQTPMGQLFKEQ